MKYEILPDGRKLVSGWVIIDGVQHYIKHKFVFCNPSLNHKAWNVTPHLSNCEVCTRAFCEYGKQLNLF